MAGGHASWQAQKARHGKEAYQRTYGQDPEQGTKAPIRLGRRPEKI